MYGVMSDYDLGQLLNKTKKNVTKRLRDLGLYRTKEEKDFITALSVKRLNRDLNYETIKSIALKFNTRQEFYLSDTSAYCCAAKNGWLDSVCEHMVFKNVSIPQLLLKDILEHILQTKCSFNNRKIIQPLEIDCYFGEYKIGWEYDGKYYHNDIKDQKKRDACNTVGVTLFNINEKNENYRNYELNIKTQLINQLPTIRSITKLDLTVEDIENYKPKLIYPNLLTTDEKVRVYNKKLSEIKLLDEELYKRIEKYKLYENDNLCIIDDKKRNNCFKSFDSYIEYLKNKNFDSFDRLCKSEHPHRVCKKFKKPILLIHKLFEK
jgi:hypothetical protein